MGASTASAAPAPQLATTSWLWPLTHETVTPTVNGLRIRSGPGTNYRIYGLLYRGDHAKAITGGLGVQTYAYHSGHVWLHVRLTRRSASGLPAGFTGWVYASYLRHV